MTKTETQPETKETNAEYESLKRLYEHERGQYKAERMQRKQALVGFSGLLDLVLKADRSIQSAVNEKMGDLIKVMNTKEQVKAQIDAMVQQMNKEDEELLKQEQGRE